VFEVSDRLAGSAQQLANGLVAMPPLVDFAQAMTQGLDQRLATITVGQQVVFEIGVALYDPDVPQHLVQHACGTAGNTLAAQAVEYVPGLSTEQANDDLAVGERGVVVGNLAQTSSHGSAVGVSKAGL
jgi:hypothetical protein